MRDNPCKFRFRLRGVTYGLSVARWYMRPDAEIVRGGYSTVQAFGVCLWADGTRPMTVGERGVW